MTTERWSDDYGLTPEEAAAIAADDALLDAIGSRSLQRDDVMDDPAARLLASWAADLDHITADDARATNVKLAAPTVNVETQQAPATVSSLEAHRTKALLAAGVVITGLLVPGGVAAAAGYSPVAPYRSIISTVNGQPPAPASDARTRLDDVQAVIARGDTDEAARLLAALKSETEIGADPELDGLIATVEDQIEAAKSNGANGPSNGQGVGNGNAAPGSNAGGKGDAKSTMKVPESNAGGNGKAQKPDSLPARGGQGVGSTAAPGRVESSPMANVPPGSTVATPAAPSGSTKAPGKSGTAGSNGNGKNKN
jgi:hypothetical protein